MEVNDFNENYSTGWVKIYRSFSKWEWYKNSKMVHLFLHLLISANHKDQKWQGQMIKRGQLITGRKSLSADTGITEQSIRTCLNKLKSTNEITIKTTNKNSVITIVNYEKYQVKEISNHETNQQLTNNQPTTNQQLTTNKNDKNKKNDKNDKKIDHERQFTILQAFKNNVIEQAKELNIDFAITEKFLNHWTERDFASGLYAWQVPETFIIKSRLKGWVKNEDKEKSDWKQKLKEERL